MPPQHQRGDLTELRRLALSRTPELVAASAGMRRDGRSADGMRPLALRLGAVGQAAGSAYLELGSTKVVCAVYGPHQTEGREYLQRGQLETALRFTSFARRDRCKSPASGSPEERELSMALGAALEASVQLDQYPKSTIAVNALVLQDDGGALAAAITCASLALADAGLLLFGMVAACSCAVLEQGVALDCSSDELRGDATGRTLVAQMPSLSHVTLLRQSGAVSFELMTEATQLALSGCSHVHAQMRSAVLQKAASAHEQQQQQQQQQAGGMATHSNGV
jgi:exosome complex component MTR3